LLEKEQEMLLHAEDIKTGLLQTQVLLDDDNAVLPLLKEVIHVVSHTKNYLTDATEWLERLNTCYVELKDLNSEMTKYADNVEDNPERLQFVNNRLSEIYTLLKKYKVSDVAQLIELRDALELQLQQIDSSDEDIALLNEKIELAYSEMSLQADLVTVSRSNVLSNIENYLIKRLSELGMPNIQFKIQLQSSADFGLKGRDEVQFLFSANKNRDMQPVQLIASGGEISRLMLSLKALLPIRLSCRQ